MMTKVYMRTVYIALALAAFLPAVTLLTSILSAGPSTPGGAVVKRTLAGELPFLILAFGGGWLVLEALRGALEKQADAIDLLAREQAEACDELEGPQATVAIAAAAALSILLELAMIRWQGAVFELFAFYKNLSLLACFLGLGLGYAVAGRGAIPLVLATPLVVVQMLALIVTRHGLSFDRRSSLKGMPVPEQLNMGARVSESLLDYIAVYWFLATVFLLTALAFLPVGQLCGRLMGRASVLRGYGLNLAGSFAGVVLMFALSAFYLPPVVWFAIGLGGLAVLQCHSRPAFLMASGGTLLATVVLAWPVSFGWELIYSPYQLLERGPSPNGLSMVRSAGTYYQRIHNLADDVTATTKDKNVKETALYYEFPYRIRPEQPADVLVLGAGTGNDVAAALRRGAKHVDAIEIDPAILKIGRLFHPEKPYDDARVTTTVTDARRHLRQTDRKYDLIVYGLLDSHTLLSHASNLRLDSFVYTVEGLREARARLKPGGLLSLSFSVLSPELGRKIYLMLEEAFDGRPPTCVQARTNYDDSVIFLQSEAAAPLAMPTAYMAENGFKNVSTQLADNQLKADVSTDDWPFFYMPRRVYPTSYLGMIVLILSMAFWLLARFTDDRPEPSDATFFLLGAGFLLLQTKGITELGLAFGNTWQVIGVVMLGMLLFAFLANLAVGRLGLRNPRPALVMVLVTLAVGWWVSGRGGMPAGVAGQVGAVVLLTCPVFFSGIAFSTLAARRAVLSKSLAANLFGALCGGLMEYNSMYFGFRFLYVLAMLLYALALVASFIPSFESAMGEDAVLTTSDGSMTH